MDQKRLSDRIMDALELALEQRDIDIAPLLSQALIMSLTRGTGGGDFTERRTLEERVIKAMDALHAMKQ